MSTVEPQRKRARVEEAAVTSIRVGEHWFEDGNVILRAGDYAFKLHRSLLSRHSKVFRDLFEVSQPGTGEDEQIDGVPVIVLQDSPEEVTLFLKLIYDGASLFNVDAKFPWKVVRAALRLGQKYDVDSLRNEALRFLEIFLPGDLLGWEKSLRDPPFTYELKDLLSIAKVTQDIQPALHKRALYKCATLLDTRQLLHGVEGTPEDEEYVGRITIAQCIDLRPWLVEKKTMLHNACLTVQPPTGKNSACRSGQMCDVKIIRPFAVNARFHSRGLDPLSSCVFIQTLLSKICHPCKEDMCNRINIFRRNLLTQELPQKF